MGWPTPLRRLKTCWQTPRPFFPPVHHHFTLWPHPYGNKLDIFPIQLMWNALNLENAPDKNVNIYFIKRAQTRRSGLYNESPCLLRFFFFFFLALSKEATYHQPLKCGELFVTVAWPFVTLIRTRDYCFVSKRLSYFDFISNFKSCDISFPVRSAWSIELLL